VLGPPEGPVFSFRVIIKPKHGSHKMHAFLHASLLKIFRSYWKKVAKIQKYFSSHTHKAYFLRTMSAIVRYLPWELISSLENNVGLDVINNLVVTEY